jgi:hypothetical protein
MNHSTIKTLAAAVFGLFLGACGSSSSSGDDPKALCMTGCNKAKACFSADIAAQIDCNAQCANPDNSASKCSNAAEILAAGKVCLAKDKCEEYLPCANALPKCKPVGDGG